MRPRFVREPKANRTNNHSLTLKRSARIAQSRSALPRLLGNRLFRSSTGVLTLASIAFLGTLYVISLYYQDGAAFRCPRTSSPGTR